MVLVTTVYLSSVSSKRPSISKRQARTGGNLELVRYILYEHGSILPVNIRPFTYSARGIAMVVKLYSLLAWWGEKAGL